MKTQNERPLLPEVQPEVGYNVQHAIPDDTCDFLREQMRAIRKNNPVVADWIRDWSKQAGSAEDITHAAICGIIVYMLLKSQAEADRMAEELKLS